MISENLSRYRKGTHNNKFIVTGQGDHSRNCSPICMDYTTAKTAVLWHWVFLKGVRSLKTSHLERIRCCLIRLIVSKHKIVKTHQRSIHGFQLMAWFETLARWYPTSCHVPQQPEVRIPSIQLISAVRKVSIWLLYISSLLAHLGEDGAGVFPDRH